MSTMNASLFDEALDEERVLRPAFLQAHAFGARVFPDILDKDGFSDLVTIAGNAGSAILVHHAEFGRLQETISTTDPNHAWEAFFRVSHEDVILEFTPASFFAWLPAGERFHVVFGNKEIVAQLRVSEKLARAFHAFVEDSGLTAKGKRFLREVYERYTI